YRRGERAADGGALRSPAARDVDAQPRRIVHLRARRKRGAERLLHVQRARGEQQFGDRAGNDQHYAVVPSRREESKDRAAALGVGAIAVAYASEADPAALVGGQIVRAPPAAGREAGGSRAR